MLFTSAVHLLLRSFCLFVLEPSLKFLIYAALCVSRYVVSTFKVTFDFVR